MISTCKPIYFLTEHYASYSIQRPHGHDLTKLTTLTNDHPDHPDHPDYPIHPINLIIPTTLPIQLNQPDQ